MADLCNGGDIGHCVYPLHRLCSRRVIGINLHIGLNAYLQEFAVFVFNGKSETVEISTAVLILGILVRGPLVQVLPGCCVQSKHTQEYDSQYFMYPVLFHSTVVSNKDSEKWAFATGLLKSR